MAIRVDHFFDGASDLSEGQGALRDLLGVTVPIGSEHVAMSTYNSVCQAGNESSLELIAVDPEAPDPARKRWFTLDDPSTQPRIAERPRALCCAVNTPDLHGVVDASPIDLGEVVIFQGGKRTWRLTVPRDGSLPEGGLVPALIEWSPEPHPSTGQPDIGVRLEAIKRNHPDPEALRNLLTLLGVGHLVQIHGGPRGLAFEVAAPGGRPVLD